MPPSTNNLFATGRNGRRYTSKAYARWRSMAGWELITQRPAPARGPVEVVIGLPAPSKAVSMRRRGMTARRKDADNFIKGILDLLVKHEVLPDDHSEWVVKVSAEWVHGQTDVTVMLRSTTQNRRSEAPEAAVN